MTTYHPGDIKTSPAFVWHGTCTTYGAAGTSAVFRHETPPYVFDEALKIKWEWEWERAVKSALEETKTKEEDMSYYESLVDFALLLGMKQEEVNRVRHIMERPDWKDRMVLFLLCREVHAGNLSYGQLGYREEKD